MLCAGITLADLPQDSDDSDDAAEAVPVSADVAGPSLDEIEQNDGTVGVDESSELSFDDEEADQAVGLAGSGEGQAMEQASVQAQAE